MKLNINFKKMATLTALTLCLTGCAKKETTKNIEVAKTISNYQNEVVSENKIYTSDSINLDSTEFIQDNQNINQADNTVMDYIDSAKEKLVDLSESEEWKTFKSKSKEYVVTGIDFLFFEGEIKNVTFSELTESGKEKVMAGFESLISTIETYYPEMTNDLSEKYQSASLFINKKYLDTLDSIKEYLGEENYNALTDINNQVKEDIGNKTNEALGFLTKKYQEWKTN